MENMDVRNSPGGQTAAHPQASRTAPQDVLLERMNRVSTITRGLEYHLGELSHAEDNDECDGVCVGHEDETLQYKYLQAMLGIELAKTRQENILLERQLIQRDEAAGLISQKDMESALASQLWRFALVGGDLWRNLRARLQLEDPSSDFPRPSGETMSIRKKLMALYTDDEGLEDRRRPVCWELQALEYYSADPRCHGRSKNQGWCHITGTWYPKPVKPTEIVPFRMDANKLAELVFGSSIASVQSPANTLLLRPGFRRSLKEYKFVIVPVNRCFEGNITRWRLDIICPDEDNPRSLTSQVGGWEFGQNIDGRELTFLGENRPNARFLYFHFLIALIRIKDLGRANWPRVWARYYQEQPFPAPSTYMRNAVIRALATYFSVADMGLVESWVYRHGFESYHIQDDLVKKEIARRVHLLVLEESGDSEDTDLWEGVFTMNYR
ncbi:hypothetical protein HDV57DRAFT_519014 [Trichoderma longibrachiatum]|uniref:HNH nuclease domain-containing protein n=1 Tax=Trichoderma longibrachiatum ATCC 18648 TaxID=983965 RepID=A0A2T4CB32_TRILO|nr:hypothetical protein M440DRAFT_1420781 [Trichoderma longibrachiatum ATCC 18648]